MSKCSVDGCSRLVDARGLCGTHYMRLRRAGLLPVGTRARAPVEVRFWRYVDVSDGCWRWTGNGDLRGYGRIGAGGKSGGFILAHRLSYQMHKGQIPDGMVVMHECDNPSCVNPAHLRAGTASENIRDSFAKGRKVCVPPLHRGEDQHLAKLDDNKVRVIRASKKTNSELAREFGVSLCSIARARARMTWRHVE